MSEKCCKTVEILSPLIKWRRYLHIFLTLHLVSTWIYQYMHCMAPVPYKFNWHDKLQTWNESLLWRFLVTKRWWSTHPTYEPLHLVVSLGRPSHIPFCCFGNPQHQQCIGRTEQAKSVENVIQVHVWVFVLMENHAAFQNLNSSFTNYARLRTFLNMSRDIFWNLSELLLKFVVW